MKPWQVWRWHRWFLLSRWRLLWTSVSGRNDVFRGGYPKLPCKWLQTRLKYRGANFFPCNLAILLAGATLCEGVPSWFCNGWIECTCVEFITWEPWWFQMSNHVRRVVCVVTPLAARSEVEWSYLFFTYVNVSRQFWRVPSILLSPLRFGCHPDRPRVSSRNICLWIYIYIWRMVISKLDQIGGLCWWVLG